VICAYGVDEIATMARSRPPEDAGYVFQAILSSLPYMEMEGGRVELLTGLYSIT
jgi:hypothetical protein